MSVRFTSVAAIVLTLTLVMGLDIAWFRYRPSAVSTTRDTASVPASLPLGADKPALVPAPRSLSTPDGAAPVARPAKVKAAAVPRPSEPALLKPVLPDSAQPSPTKADPPKFDVVRVEPNGDTVVAGRGVPDATVDLLVAGTVVAQAKTDANGHFAMLPPALAPGNNALTLRQIQNGVVTSSTQSIAVSVPEKNKGGVVVALAEPGQPTKVLAAPTGSPQRSEPGGSPAQAIEPGATKPVVSSQSIAGAPPANSITLGGVTTAPAAAGGSASRTDVPAPGAKSIATASLGKAGSDSVVIRSVELENGNGFFASGQANPGTQVRVYLNDSQIASVTAGADRGWSVKIVRGLAGGHYNVRADALGDGARVASRVEVPFDVPVAMAASPVPAPSVISPSVQSALATPAPGLASQSNAAVESRPSAAIVDEIKTTIVASGDNLWDISRVRLGDGRRYTRIYAANMRQIRDPKLIYPGQVFVLPTEKN